MPIDVSVVVPFFNPGANIEDCLTSLVEQTLSPDRFEVILVDDGSTDGSDARVDGWVERYPDLMTVHHIAASGGPARPRNIGVDVARGRYVQFLDSDDTLAPRALERQLEVADDSAADVVVGKLSSDFRGIWHPLFRRTVTGKTLANYPLIQNLTVCKMFRRDFMIEHGVRFPEGPHYIEDQQICIQAYAHARSVAVVADTACYFYRRRRTGGRNFGDTTIVPADYFRELAAILDVIDTQVEPAARPAARARYYRGEMLGRLRGEVMLNYDPAYRREIVDEIRNLATTRFPAEAHDELPMFTRVQSRLLLDDDVDGLVQLARGFETLKLTATTTAPQWRDGQLMLRLDAHLTLGDEPFRLERYGDDWALPESMAPGVSASERRLGSVADTDVDLATISRADSQLWSTTKDLSLAVDDTGCPRVTCEVGLDPATVLGGHALTPGLWDLRLRVMFGGLTRTCPIRPGESDPPAPTAWITGADSGLQSVTAYWTSPAPTLAIDVDEWMHPLHDLVETGQTGLPLAASRLFGPAGATRRATLIAEPADVAPRSMSAEVWLSPDGSTIAATSAQSSAALPGPLSLRIGELGGAPPRRLH